MVQNFIIIFLIWIYNKEINFGQKTAVAAMFGGYAYALFTPGILTDYHWSMISASGTMLGLIARLPIIWGTFQNKSTGQMSFIT